MAFTPEYWDAFYQRALLRYSSTTGVYTTSTGGKDSTAGIYTGAGRNAAVFDLPSSVTEYWLSCWVKPTQWWTSGSYKSPVLCFGDGTYWFAAIAGRYGTTEVHYTVNGNSGWTLISGEAWSSSNFQRVKMYCKVHASSGRLVIHLDDSEILDFTGDTTAAGNSDITKIALGGPMSGTYQGTCYFDDFVCGTGTETDIPGDLKIEVRPLTADQGTNNWTPSTGTDHYAVLDEIPFSDTDYLYINTVATIERFTKGSLTGTIGTVHGVGLRMQIGTEGSPTPANIRGLLYISSTDYASSDETVPTSGEIMPIWTVSPATTNPFTESEINSMAVGAESRT